MHCRRQILGMLSNDCLARTLLGPNGSSRSRRILKDGSPSTRCVLLLEVSPKSMVSITLRSLHLSPNSLAFIQSSPWPLKKTGLLKSLISSVPSSIVLSMRRSSCSFQLALLEVLITMFSSPSSGRQFTALNKPVTHNTRHYTKHSLSWASSALTMTMESSMPG